MEIEDVDEGGGARALAGVVWRRKVLLILPAITVAVFGGVAGLLVWAEVLLGGSLLLGVLGLLVLSFLAVFGTSALLVAAADALRGRPVGVGAGYRRAAGRLGVLARWAPLGAVQQVGALLMVGLVWAQASYLVVPALVLDGAGVRAAMRGSREAYRRDRGEFLRGATWLSLPAVVSFVPSLVVLSIGLMATDRVLGTALMVGAALCLGAGVTVTASLFGVFRARLYLASKRAAVVEAAPWGLHVSPVE
ncbi:hypothetical protein [Kitasatospora sp. NPDC094011]|uniref:hypothetical protein n=1 Tax=Kitasatospora sp. NPDC094011 TaxID=3364090 RepID=UPI003817E3B0